MINYYRTFHQGSSFWLANFVRNSRSFRRRRRWRKYRLGSTTVISDTGLIPPQLAWSGKSNFSRKSHQISRVLDLNNKTVVTNL